MTALTADNLRPPLPVRTWAPFALLLLTATVWRILLFNGPLGSDDVVYLARSLDVATGEWGPANYNGALRYGFNIPAGLMVRLFGVSEFAANLWPLICSAMELAAVWWFCRSRLGDNTALVAVALLAMAPLHVAAATRIHADAVASAFLTLSFVLFFESEDQKSARLAFLAGLAMGMVFWTKELLALALFAFLPWPLLIRDLRARWLWVIAGGLTMLLGHLLLMWALNGDPLHLFRTVLGQLQRNFIGDGIGEDSALYYFRYLLADIRHTALLAPLAALGLVAGVLHTRGRSELNLLRQTGFWLISLLAFLSFFPVSFSPLKLAMKQSNYLILFIAPLSILAAHYLASLPPPFRRVLWLTMLALCIPLGILEQQSYKVFVSNSRAVVEHARTHPGDRVFGASNNAQLAHFESMIHRDPNLATRVSQLPSDFSPLQQPAAGGRLIVVEDRQTIGHASNDHPLSRVPHCWQAIGQLQPRGLGFSAEFTTALANLASLLPGALGTRLSAPFRQLAAPAPGKLYELPPDNPWCHSTASQPS